MSGPKQMITKYYDTSLQISSTIKFTRYMVSSVTRHTAFYNNEYLYAHFLAIHGWHFQPYICVTNLTISLFFPISFPVTNVQSLEFYDCHD